MKTLNRSQESGVRSQIADQPFGDHHGIPIFQRASGANTEVFFRDPAGRTNGLKSASMSAERMREILIESMTGGGRTLLSQKRTVR